MMWVQQSERAKDVSPPYTPLSLTPCFLRYFPDAFVCSGKRVAQGHFCRCGRKSRDLHRGRRRFCILSNHNGLFHI